MSRPESAASRSRHPAGSDRPWRLAPVLATLRAEVDLLWPARSTLSDGSIGDRAHQARDSDHSPNDRGVVRAWDLTSDTQHGPDLDDLATWLVRFGQRGSQRLSVGSYLIWNRRIWSYRTSWHPREYRGVNPHRTHMHLSAPLLPEFYGISRPWGLTRDILARDL